MSWLLLLVRFLAAAIAVPLLVPGVRVIWSLGIAISLSICLAPLAATGVRGGESAQPWYLATIQEALLGAFLGMSLSILLVALQWLASFSLCANPWGSETAGPAWPFRQLFLLVAIAGFFQVRGDLIVIQQIAESLQRFPPGQVHISTDVIPSIVSVLTICFTSSLKIAAPLIATILFAHLLVGFVSRSLSPIWLPVLQGIATPVLCLVMAACLLALSVWLPAQLPALWVDSLDPIPRSLH